MSTIQLEENVYYVVNRIMRATKEEYAAYLRSIAEDNYEEKVIQ